MEGANEEINILEGINSETEFEKDMGLTDMSTAHKHIESFGEHVRSETGTAIAEIRHEAEMVTADSRDAFTQEAFKVCKDTKLELSKSAAEIAEKTIREMALAAAKTEHERRRDAYEKKHEFREDLIDFYQERCYTLPLSPLVRNRDVPLNMIYVTPKLEHVEFGFTGNIYSTNKTGRATSFKSIFGRDGTPAKNIYIQGEPGTGKTSLCLKIVNEWCEYHSKYGMTVDQNTELKRYYDDATPSHFYLSDTDVVSADEINSTESETTDKEIQEVIEKSKPHCPHFSDTEVIGDYDFLFFLSLRDAQGYDCDIDTMIENQIIPRLSSGDNYNRVFLQRILKYERCLILLDGLDEWSHPEQLSNTCRYPVIERYIPHRKARPYCTLLTTKRPWKLADIKDSEIDNLFKLSGIEDTETLVENVTACLSSNGTVNKNDFMTEIHSNSLEEFLSLPLIVMQLICLWHDGKSLGPSLCGIYSGIVKMLFDRRPLEFGKGHMLCLNQSDLQTKSTKLKCLAEYYFSNVSEELLFALGKLACERLISKKKESSLLFDNKIVKQYLLPGQLKIAIYTGILSEREQRNKLKSKTSTYCFLHKTFQEFLAAIYFSTTNRPRKEIETIIEAYGTRENILGISDFFIFICGLNPMLATIISERIMKLLTLKINELLKASHEQKSVLFEKEMLIKQVQKMIVEGIKECQENGHENTYLALHHTVIGRMCSDWEGWYLKQLLEMEQNKSCLETLIICRSPHQNWAIEYLQKCCNSVKNIGLYYHNQSSLSLIQFQELDYFYFEHAILECLKVRDFNPMGCVIADTNSTTVNLILTSIQAETPKLKSLSIRYVRGVISARVREIGTNLQYLHLSYVDILDCLDLSLCQNLKQVDLQWSKLKSLKINADNLEEVNVQRLNAQKLIEFQSALTTGIPRLYRAFA